MKTLVKAAFLGMALVGLAACGGDDSGGGGRSRMTLQNSLRSASVLVVSSCSHDIQRTASCWKATTDVCMTCVLSGLLPWRDVCF